MQENNADRIFNSRTIIAVITLLIQIIISIINTPIDIIVIIAVDFYLYQ